MIFEFANGQRLKMRSLADVGSLWTSDSWTSTLAPTVVLGLAIVAIVAAIVRSHPVWSERSMVMKTGVTVLITAAVFGFVVIMLTEHPRVACLILVGLAGVPSAFWLLRGIKAGEVPTWGGAVWILTFALLVPFAAGIPDRYSSWTQSYALFLLLWAAFIGASMATSKGRHLKIDAVRKSVPQRLQPIYNFFSYVVAAVFSGAFCYLAWKYTIDRLDTSTVAGEIPDWLKVAAIPVALTFITIRFSARALMSLAGEEDAGAGEFILPTPAAGEGESVGEA
jgi:C4-dicarboxylate transporter DctQ subunit